MPGPPGRVRSPSPQPRETRSGSGPPCSRTPPGCGIRGQIRRRFAPPTQMSWIGKWGWGEETDPAIPEGGVSLKLGAAEGVGGCGRRPWAPAQEAWASTRWAGGIREELGSCLATVCLVSFIFPSAAGTHLGLQPPVPVFCTHRCSAPTSALHPLVHCSRLSPCSRPPRCPAVTSAVVASWVPAFWTNVPQRWFAGAGTSTRLLDINLGGRAEIWA